MPKHSMSGVWMSLRQVGFTWPGADMAVFEGVDLELGRGWYGLVGENGAGKSTLLSILSGELQGQGRRSVSGVVVRVPQESATPTPEVFAFGSDESGAARVLRATLGLESAELERWATLSAGERKRWLVGAAVASRPDILLLDEPESHLDARGREVLVEALRSHRGLGVLVAHDRDLLDALTTNTIHLEKQRVRLFEGGVSAALAVLEDEERALVRRRQELAGVVEQRAAQREHARQVARSAANTRTSDRMKGIRDHDARTCTAINLTNWAAGSHARRARKAEDALAKARVELESVRVERKLGGDIAFGFERSGRAIVASVEADTIEVGGRVLLRDVALFVGREDRIHLAGDNGAGKSTLLARLVASVEPDAVVHLPQELDEARVTRLIREVAALDRQARGRYFQVVALLGASPERVMNSERPSPGEAKKLALALGVAKGAKLLVLDEPENHLDLPSVERLAEALARWPGALVLVTHDLSLARRVASSTWRIESGRVMLE